MVENNSPILEVSEKRSGLGCCLCKNRGARWIKRKSYPWGIPLCGTCLILISQPRVDKLIEVQQHNEKRLLRALKEQGFITDPTYSGRDIRD